MSLVIDCINYNLKWLYFVFENLKHSFCVCDAVRLDLINMQIIGEIVQYCRGFPTSQRSNSMILLGIEWILLFFIATENKSTVAKFFLFYNVFAEILTIFISLESQIGRIFSVHIYFLCEISRIGKDLEECGEVNWNRFIVWSERDFKPHWLGACLEWFKCSASNYTRKEDWT